MVAITRTQRNKSTVLYSEISSVRIFIFRYTALGFFTRASTMGRRIATRVFLKMEFIHGVV